MTAAWTIRRATVADAAMVAELAARTFEETFATQNRPEDMEAHRARTYGEALQRREIEDPNGVTLLIEQVVEQEGEAIGYAQLRRGHSPACFPCDAPVEIGRFYVAREWHGRGVAQALMSAVRAAARTLGGTVLWLGVWERNPRAIAFYAKCGFRDVGSQPYIVGSDVQTDRVMVQDINFPDMDRRPPPTA